MALPSSKAPLAAITGGSGFVGRHLVAALAQAGWRLRLLLRRDPDVGDWRGAAPEVVPGSLADAAALQRLVEGADAVIHGAGLIKAARRREFFAVNAECTGTLARVTRALAPQARFILLSSIAAREPGLSDYAASKRAGEVAVLEALGDRATVLRPSAVYGPGDRETLRVFRLAAHRFVPIPAPVHARVALIHVHDLARMIAALATCETKGRILTATDARPQGYEWEEVMQAAARALGNRRARCLHAPAPLLRAVAWAGDIARSFGVPSMLNSQKLRELRHVDWSAAHDELAQPPGWSARFDLPDGFADAVAWYRAAGWLPGSS